jgi:hypothetical protein
MLHMCVWMHSRFIENHPIRILEDGLLISKVVLSHLCTQPPLVRSIPKVTLILVEFHMSL